MNKSMLKQQTYRDSSIVLLQINHGRLVNSDGIIFPAAFYYYLSAWASNDALAYATSQAYFHPEPKEWHHAPDRIEGPFYRVIASDLQGRLQPFTFNNMNEYLLL